MNGKKPNKAEKAWISGLLELGCIVCYNELGLYSPPSIHHINGGNNHLDTIGLCWPHHQSGRNDKECVSRHPFKKQFENRYGTEIELLIKCRELINENSY